jgi:hypothetical protein
MNKIFDDFLIPAHLKNDTFSPLKMNDYGKQIQEVVPSL